MSKQPYGNVSFTEREQHCLFYVLQGYTFKKIARCLAISPDTVDTHLSHIKHKIGVQHKNDIIGWASRCGIIRFSSTWQEKVQSHDH